tara:strand:+ start:79 stop:531 length:453 start_codon:yes stop_codon:yes gene_type:complete
VIAILPYTILVYLVARSGYFGSWSGVMRAINTEFQSSMFQTESTNKKKLCNKFRPFFKEEFVSRYKKTTGNKNMLVLVREVGEELTLKDTKTGQLIKVKLSSIVDDETACIGIDAPQHIKIDRSEVLEARRQIPDFIKNHKNKKRVDRNV